MSVNASMIEAMTGSQRLGGHRRDILFRKCVHCFLLLLLTAGILTQSLEAQPGINFKRLETWNYPLIHLVFKPTCAGVYRPDMGPQNYEVRENGFLMKDATIHCMEDTACCVSAVLVLDRSGSMGWGIPNAGLTLLAHQYIDSMEPCDEAAIVSFNQDVTLDLPMTSDKTVLHAAVNRLGSNGFTACYDAIGAGIEQLARTAKNRCRGVIVVSDLGENSSTTFLTAMSVAKFARSNDVRLYFALSCPTDRTQTPLIDSTRGRCLLGSPLIRGFAGINDFIRDDFKECYLSYVSVCPDGKKRVVELLLKNFCGDSAVWRGSYTAPLDSSKFNYADIRIGSADIYSGREVVLPLVLETPVRQVFAGSDIILNFDTKLLQLIEVSNAGTLLEGRNIGFSALPDGASIHLEEHVELDTKGGVLLYLRFRARDVASIIAHVAFKSWDFRAYCLIPRLHDGQIRIRKEPSLHCDLSMPTSVSWSDSLQRYQPDPLELLVTVTNAGSQAAWQTRATIITDMGRVELISPTTETQYCSPMSVPAGGSGTARWLLRLRKSEEASSVHVQVTITSYNHPPVECHADIVFDAVRTSALTCGIAAPDTIYFMEQYYLPEEFDIHVNAQNTGEAPVRDVRVQLLQDTRFTNESPSSQTLAHILLPQQTAYGVFRVLMHPRHTDGYDTVRINVQGAGTDPAWCEYPIWVQRVRMPEFALACTATPDSLIYNEAIADYSPNPFLVTTVAENIGETYAEECSIMMMGPPRITPLGTNLRPLGTMSVGDRKYAQWELIALPRVVAGWDTLIFQVSGKGGLAKQIVLTECRVPVYIPAMRMPDYRMLCTAPDSVRFVDDAWNPDPLTFSLRIENIGNAAGHALAPTILLPSSMRLADGEQAKRYLPSLAAGGSTVVEWKIRPENILIDGTHNICATMVDTIGTVAQCCVDVFIGKAEAPTLAVQCRSIDTLFVDAVTGGYLGNPFDATLNISNIGKGSAKGVRASIAVVGSGMSVLEATEREIGQLGPGASMQVVWRMQAHERTLPENILLTFNIDADNHPSLACPLSIHIPAAQFPKLVTDCGTVPEDSLLFDWSVGAYAYEDCTLLFSVANVGGAAAHDVSALLILPSGVMLSPGETVLKPLAPPDLAPGQTGTASWRIRTQRSSVDVLREFRIVARTGNIADVECIDGLYVQGAPKRVVLSFPEYELLRYGESTDVPIIIDRTVGLDLTEYVVNFSYDPDVLAIAGVSNRGTLTSGAWVGAKMETPAPGLSIISDYTTGEPLATVEGILVNIRVTGIYKNAGKNSTFGQTSMMIDTLTSLLNRGEIEIGAKSGTVIVTDPCLLPLVATGGILLEQNRPNPFSTSTAVGFKIIDDGYVRLSVYDRHGREVRVLVEGELSKGTYTQVLRGEDLPSGLYFYRLYSGSTVRTRTMQILR